MTGRSAGAPGLGRDIVLLVGVRFAAVGAGFLTSILAARVLGPAPLGAAGLGMTAGAIAALLANGGLNIASIYFLGRRPDDRRRITSWCFTLGLIAVAIAALLILLVGRWVAPDALGNGHGDLLVASASLAASVVAFELSGSLLLGHDRRSAYLVTQGIEGLGSLALVAAVFMLGLATAAGYVLGSALAALLASVFAMVVTGRLIGGLRLALDLSFAREALGLGLRGQVGNVIQMLNLRLDLLLVPLFVDLRAAGIYLIAVRMSEVISQVASAAAAYLFPAVARLDERQTALTERMIRATLIVVVAGGLVIGVFAPVLLELFFGSAYAEGSTALRITLVAMIPLSVQRLMASDLKGRGRAGLVSVSAGFALVATVACDVILIPPFGIAGASLASVLAYSTGAAAMLVATAGSPEPRCGTWSRDRATSGHWRSRRPRRFGACQDTRRAKAGHRWREAASARCAS